MTSLVRRAPRLCRSMCSVAEHRKLTLARKDPQIPVDPNFLPNQDIYLDQLLRGHDMADKFIVRLPDMMPPDKDRWGRTSSTPLFSIGRPGGVREYVFNREAAGNPLDLQAVRWLDARVWMAWRMTDITAVVIRGTGNSTFSRGVPLLSAATDGVGPNSIALKNLQEYYQLVYLCSRTPKLIGIFNGRCSGNSTAFLLPGPFRFATPSSEFTLQQTSQGYFPDAGLPHFLARLENKLGYYLALTGATLRGADLMHAGIANYYMTEDGKDALVDHMECNDGYHASMREYVNVVNDHSWLDEPFSLAPHLDTIDRCFQANTIETIMDALQAENTSFADATIDILLKKCPLSLKVTLHALRESAKLPLEEALKNDFRVAVGMMSSPEFVNGVKAYAARDAAYKWPRTLRDVRDSDIKTLFELDERQPELRLPLEDYHDPYEIDWSLEARKRYKKSQAEKGKLVHLPHILDDIERS